MMTNKTNLNSNTELCVTENNPNAGILIYALKNLGYDNYSAIYDLIDNCIDAEATSIKVVVEKKSEKIKILIIDNGYGMDLETLDQALRLGSDVERGNPDELGKFGMGASTASLSLCNKTTIITKVKDGDILESSTDVNEIINKKEFIKTLGNASESNVKLFNKYLKSEESGTIIILSECVGVKNKNVAQFKAKLTKDIGRIYRKFLGDIKFYVNSTKVQLNDPLWLEHPDTEVFSDEEYTVTYKNQLDEECKSSIRVKLVLLPDLGQDGNKDKGFNLANQGFYIMRNNREIYSGFIPSSWVSKHPKFNRFRGEISFTAELDEEMGVDFRKKGINMTDSIESTLKSYIKPQITAIGSKLDKKRAAVESSEINHNEAAELIGKKSDTLIVPKVKQEARNTSESCSKNTSNEPTDSSKTKNNNKSKKVSANVRFDTVHSGRGGNIFTSYQEGKTTVIEWNVDHPFYERFVIANKEDKTLVTSVDFLIYSLAVAQNQALGDDDNKAMLIESMLSIMSANMRALLQ